jgi:hypothetical protein
MRHRTHQIYYSERTRAANDPGFIPLDNLANPRPDWREYGPIRQFLLNQPLDENCAYGFFSPKFRDKTHLGAADVDRFIAQADADVYVFSPFFDQSAFFLNVFEQATLQHPGSADALAQAMHVIEPDIVAAQLVMSSLDTVFCNYFVAKPRFWREWLLRCERLYAVAEAGQSDLARSLNANVDHLGGAAPLKVFVIERVVSLLLNTRRDFKVRVYDPAGMPIAAASMTGLRGELCTLDALKIAYAAHHHGEYLAQFSAQRQSLLGRLQR